MDTQENKSGDNGKIEAEKPQFKQFIKIFFNDETGEYAFETNVPNPIIGYGLLEFGKKGVDNHIAKVQQKKIVQGGGVMNFARRIMK